MDKDKTGGRPPELEDILAEFAPVEEKKPAPAPERGPVGTGEKPLFDPIFDSPPVEEAPEPTIRMLGRDGKLLRETPLRREGPEKKRTAPEKKPARDKGAEAPSRRPRPEKKTPVKEEGPAKGPEEKEPGQAAAKGKAPEKEKGQEKEKTPWWKRKKPPVHLSEKVIEFPGDPGLTGRIGKLVEKADAYAETMFPDDDGPDPEEELRNRLLPGVDYEDEPTHAPTPRRRRQGRAKPDIPPAELAKKLGRRLGFLHTRAFLALLWCLPQIYLMVAGSLGLPLPPVLAGDHALLCRVAVGAMALSALLALDVLAHGLKCILKLRMEGESLLLLALCAAAADGLTMPVLADRDGGAPYCGVMAVALFFALWGRFLKRSALRQSCRVAAGAQEPYLVTLDERAWNGHDAYMKWSGEPEGYGSQLQAPDGAQRAYHVAAPLILLAAVVLALVASVGQKRPALFCWALSATLTAGCGFTAFLAFAMPFSAVARRLSKIGAALGGWDSLRWGKRGTGAVLTDGDLFPPGSVTLNGLKLTGETSLETLVSYAATLVRESGSGMERPFHDLLRTQGSIYRKCSGVVFHEGGVTGIIGGRQVYVGSGAFMTIMKIQLPPGLNVKNAVFCAVDGHLEGIFALNYRLHPAIRPALGALIGNRIGPILATRDFCVIPEMLRRRFKLPAEKMEFPSLERRRELSSSRQEHDPALAAVLCREGLGPYAEAVVGGRRLARSTRMGVAFSLLGSTLGLGLTAYLTAAAAFTSLSAGALLVFLLLWLVPTTVISGWVNSF